MQAQVRRTGSLGFGPATHILEPSGVREQCMAGPRVCIWVTGPQRQQHTLPGSAKVGRDPGARTSASCNIDNVMVAAAGERLSSTAAGREACPQGGLPSLDLSPEWVSPAAGRLTGQALWASSSDAGRD